MLKGSCANSSPAGRRASGEVEQAAKARGISETTLRRAADESRSRSGRPGTHGLWYWMLPDGQPQRPEPSANRHESNLLTPSESEVSKLSEFSGEVHP